MKGEVWMIVESNCEEENVIEVDNVMVMVCVKLSYEAIRRAMAETRTMLGTFELLEDKKLLEMVDVFGWCMWDVFYIDVMLDGIE